MSTDPISDMFNIIKNGQAVFKETAVVPFSKIKYEIARLLEEKNFIKKAEKKGRRGKRIIEITLKYEIDKETLKYEIDKETGRPMRPAILKLKRISKPGKRIYRKDGELKSTPYNLLIVSTSKGIMTDKEAKKKKLGGEVIAEVW